MVDRSIRQFILIGRRYHRTTPGLLGSGFGMIGQHPATAFGGQRSNQRRDDFARCRSDIGRADALSPVSYTHLDVYKRQAAA